MLNSCPIRLSLGAVQISNGHLIYFNNINYRIEVEHIMASAALPRAFLQLISMESYIGMVVCTLTPH
ncbi:hypothetical protein PGH42_11135 [Legionella pneumophila]|nr:hypothetical protein PGH42_11135 [Legionella pneumophila]